MATMAAPSPLPPAREIPTAFSASVRQWWATGDKASAVAEERLLRRLPFFRSASDDTPPVGPVVATSSRVDLNKPKHFLNTLSMSSTNPAPGAPPPAVLLPGYGAGIGFFFNNLSTLAQWAGRRNSQVYAVDWLGMGRSARVPFTVKAPRKDIPGRVREAESFFIDSLEEWRTKMQLDQMTLIGHSLGAYLSVAYALKYPNRVNKLILLSPAGVPRDPNQTTVPERELLDSQPSPSGSPASSNVEFSSQHKVDEIRAEQTASKPPQSRSRRFFMYLWEEGWSPFQVVRNTFFWGPMLVGKYSSRRFSGLTEEDTRDMHDYILNITLAKGSGEYCISHILSPGAHARMPLVDRVSALKIPVTFVYGDHDWMDPEGGEQSVENLRKAGNGNARSYIVNNAGHHVYLDNPTAVNDLMTRELDRRPVPQ